MGTKGPVMYRMKPVFELKENITLPTNMYRMKNINSSNSVPSARGDNNDIVNVQQRQDILLQKLAEIKNLLAALKDEVAVPKMNSTHGKENKMCGKPNFTQFGITHDVVLNLSIKKQSPPYSLLAVNKIWPNCFLKYSCHLHSSASSLPTVFKQFQEKLETQTCKGEPDLNIRIVWKNVDTDCEFIISPIKSVPLIGEVNILRFLNASYQYSSDIIKETLMDEKLDACYCLTRCQSNDAMKPYLQILSNGLENSRWLCGDYISIVDLAAWSVFKQMKKNNLGMQTLNNWYKNCNEVFDV